MSQATNILDVPVRNERIAIGIMAQFLDTANKRGAFSLDESAKIVEAIRFFQREPLSPEAAQQQQQQPGASGATAAAGSGKPPATPQKKESSAKKQGKKPNLKE